MLVFREDKHMMDKQAYILLFNCLHPDFFESESVCALPEEYFFDEMILFLNEFDMYKYDKELDYNVSFGFYDGDLDELKKEVEKVEKHWTPFFNGKDRIFCGYVNGKVASFCLVGNMGTHNIKGYELKIGGPGCVGTLPQYRDKGIGLTMVKHVTQILREEGYDYSYIHYTYLAPWYEKLGYRTVIKWNRNGIK